MENDWGLLGRWALTSKVFCKRGEVLFDQLKSFLKFRHLAK